MKINKLFLFVLIFSAMMLMYFYSLATLYRQTEWWDSAEYLLKARSIVEGTPGSGWAPHREIIPALIWVPFFAIGLGETGIHLFMMLLALIGVILVYLLGREMFNENIGIISALFFSCYHLYLFYFTRLTMYVIAPVLFTAAVLFFWKYIKTGKKMMIIASFLTIGLGMTIYYNTAFLLPIIGLFYIITNKKFFMDKNLWIAGILTLVVLLPYFAYSMITFGSPLPRLKATQYAIATEAGGGPGMWLSYITLFPYMLTLPGLALFIVGLFMMYQLFISIDLVVREKVKEYNTDLFLLIWIVLPVIIYSYIATTQGERGGIVMPEYLNIIFPAVFMIVSKPIVKLYELISPKFRLIAVVACTAIIVLVLFFQLSTALAAYRGKINSFDGIRDAGKFVNMNSEPGDMVICASVPQMTYYSERETIGLGETRTEQEWLDYLANYTNKTPKFFILSVYEPHPEWAYTLPQRRNMTMLAGMGTYAEGQPATIVFQYK